ncbi:MAG TPA: VTT domain-containing protein [Candidatus Babeliales bacterium]|nr:VTT domain-containing protein [Candidatus Babeliales bacterium]
MNKFYKKILFLVLVASVIGLLYYLDIKNYLTLEFIQSYSHALLEKVERHYFISIVLFIGALSISTIVGLPVTIPLILLSGYLYGTFWGAVYSTVAVVLGCTSTFLIFRYLLKDFLKERYHDQLAAFEGKMQGDTLQYLVVLHYMSIVPFFIINLFGALTTISLEKFMLSVVLGSFPLYLIYSFTGQQLSTMKKVSDIFSPSIIGAMVLLTALVLVPTIVKSIKKRR